ncbi:hypothetical protein JTB14_010433 [Gonioctena quinquepunctata]|nr:hypothetical protein JTB14_010433 [Gonioctena quinquepunctata]
MDCRKSVKSTIVKRVDSKETSSNLELKSRYERLVKESNQLDKEIGDLEKKGITTDLQPQMTALHEYNDMKDLAQLVLGYLADVELVTITELHRRFDLPLE